MTNSRPNCNCISSTFSKYSYQYYWFDFDPIGTKYIRLNVCKYNVKFLIVSYVYGGVSLNWLQWTVLDMHYVLTLKIVSFKYNRKEIFSPWIQSEFLSVFFYLTVILDS